jgi:hypothetical protein
MAVCLSDISIGDACDVVRIPLILITIPAYREQYTPSCPNVDRRYQPIWSTALWSVPATLSAWDISIHIC